MLQQFVSALEVTLPQGVTNVIEVEDNRECRETDERCCQGEGNARVSIVDVGDGPECLWESSESESTTFLEMINGPPLGLLYGPRLVYLPRKTLMGRKKC